MQLPVRGHPLHTRSLTLVVTSRADGRWHARGDIIDLRKVGFVPLASDIQPAGIIHQMSIDLIVDPARSRIDSVEIDQPVVAIEPSVHGAGECCRDPAPRLLALAGEQLDGGFARRLSGVFGGPLGCSHLLTLFQLMASGLRRAILLEAVPGGGVSARGEGERLFRRAAFADGFEADDESIEMAVQLADFHTRSVEEGAPVSASVQRLSRQWDVRLFGRVSPTSRTLGDLRLAERQREADALANAEWRDRTDRLAGLEATPVVGGTARRLFEIFSGPDDHRLLDATLQLAPAYIQVMAAVMDRWLAQAAAQDSGDPDSAQSVAARRGAAGLQIVGGTPDSCYMWRGDGPLAKQRQAGERSGD